MSSRIVRNSFFRRLFFGHFARLLICGTALVMGGATKIRAEAPPVVAWAQNGGSTIPDSAMTVVADAAGNTYVAGSFGGTATFGTTTLTATVGYDLFLAKLNPAGQYLWARNIEPGAPELYPFHLIIDGAGSPVLMANIPGDGGGNNSLNMLYLAKLDTSGNIVWSKKIQSGFLGSVLGGGITVDAANNIYVAGSFDLTATFGPGVSLTSSNRFDVFLAKFSSSGTALAARSFGQSTDINDEGHGVVVDASGNVYVAAHFGGSITVAGTQLTSAGGTDLAIVKYDNSLNPVWAKRFGAGGDELAYGLIRDGSGNLYLLASVSQQITLGSVTLYPQIDGTFMVARLDTDGNVVWGTLIGPGPYGGYIGTLSGSQGFTTDTSGNVFVAGRNYFAKLNAAGTNLWARSVSGVEDFNDVAVLNNTNYFLCGRYSGAVTFDSVSLNPIGAGDVFVTKMVQVPDQLPVVTIPPVSQTVTIGANVTFTAAATGSAPLTYQWQHNGVDIFGETRTNLTLLSVNTNSAGTYRVIVTNPAGSVPSTGATLTVNLIPPSITFQPNSQTVAEGSDVQFLVGAFASTPWTVQWQHSGTNLPGATTITLQLSHVTLGQAGPYVAFVTNAVGWTNSDPAFLTVTQAVVVAPVITQHPASQTVTAGSSVTFSVSVTGSEPLSYQWKKNNGVISGAQSSSYLIPSVQAGDAGSYSVVVTNSGGIAPSNPATLAVNPVPAGPSIVQQPADRSVPVGGSVTFVVVATGTAPLAYQWQRNGTNISGAVTNTYSIAYVQTNHAGAYTVVVTNSLNRVTSDPARLTVLPAPSAPSVDPTLALGVGFDSWVNVLDSQHDGRLVAGGLFTHYNSVVRRYVARLNLDGSLDTTFNPGAGPDGALVGLALQPDGKILIGGFFKNFAGNPRSHIARLNVNGSLDTTFDPGSGTSNNVAPIALQADGRIVFGGDFTNFSGVTSGRIARVNSDGSRDTSFQPGTGADNEVKALAVQPDGRILVGGAFGKFNGVSRVSIARLNSDGTLDTTFDPGSGALSWVNTIALQPDGRILIGGPFTTYNGVARKGVARLMPNGALDTGFNPGAGANNWVNSIGLQPDGKIVIGGIFTNYNGVSANHLARLNADGSRDTTFNIGSGLDQTVQRLITPPDGTIVAGGLFTSVNGVPAGRIARFVGLSGSPMPVIDAQPGLSGTLLSWPTYGLGWDVESTADLGTPFASSGLTTGTTNGISFSTIPAGTGQLFLRLKRNP